MTVLWFSLAVLCLVGALALLYVDRSRRRGSGRIRQIWAKAQGYSYKAAQPNLPAQFHRSVLAKQEYQGASDVVRGTRRGEKFMLFDVGDVATIVAVERKIASSVDLDIRPRDVQGPRKGMEPIGAMEDWIFYATDIDIARRACDQRMVAFIDALPPKIDRLWSEGKWTLGALPMGCGGRDWDAAIHAVTRLSGILHVLPPAAPQSKARANRVEPGRPDAEVQPPAPARRGAAASR
jgi:hypothetical protein